MATDTVSFLERVVGEPAHLVGWSDGGIIGLLVAASRPDLVRKLVVVGTNFNTDGLAPGVEDVFEGMDPHGEDVAMFRDAYVEHSPDGGDHWPVVFAKFVAMLKSEPHISVEQLTKITAPTLIVVGDDDMVSLEHTLTLYRSVPAAELAVVPGTSHAVLMEKPALFNRLVLDFLEHEPIPTMLPLRRADAPGTHTP
jgi:pimeloyl-ACP methyl ester carboxylesterase